MSSEKLPVVSRVEDVGLVRWKVRNGGEWAEIFLEGSTGLVVIVSSYGTWSYYWSHRGSISLEGFLCGIDSSYAGSKLVGQSYLEFDDEATFREIKASVLRYRREKSYSKKEAREEFDLVQRCIDGEICWEEWADNTAEPDYLEMRLKKVASFWEQFWIKIWIPFTAELRRITPDARS